MSAAVSTPTLLQLAKDAEKMPWEDKAPLMLRLNFQESITADIFLELVEALCPFANYACSPVGQCKCHNCRARDVLAKIGAAS